MPKETLNPVFVVVYTPLQKEIEDHEVENQLPQGDYREEHKEESEHRQTILTDGGCANQRESIDGS